VACLGGFYFFEEAGAAKAAGGLNVGGQGEKGKLGAPAAARRLATHWGIACSAACLHGESMARTEVGVESESRRKEACRKLRELARL